MAIKWTYKKLATLNIVASYTLKHTKDKALLHVLNKHFINSIGKSLLDVDNISEACIYGYNYTYRTLAHYYNWLKKNPNKMNELDSYKTDALQRLEMITEKEEINIQTKLKL